MNRVLLALAAAVVVVAGIVVVVNLGGDGDSDGVAIEATTDAGPAALPSTSADASDPFDFDASALDPEYVWEDAEIHLTCGQLLGEAQVARFLDDSIGASEFTVGEHLPGGYHLVCKFWSDPISGNFLQIEYWSGDQTVAFCEEGAAEAFGYADDPSGPADSFYDIDGGTAGLYRTCFPTARLDITGVVGSAIDLRPASVGDYRDLAAFYAGNRTLFDRAAQTF